MSDEPPTEQPISDDSALLKPKPKREQTEKQKAVWAKAQQTRLDNAKLKKEALLNAISEIESKKKKPKEEPPLAIEKPKPKPKVVYESGSEDEVVVVKKKKKKIVYESESESEEEAAPPPKPVKTKVVAAKLPETKPVIRFF